MAEAKTIGTALVTLCLGAALAGCSSHPRAQSEQSKEVSRYGSIGAELQLGSGIVINEVLWTLTNSIPPAGFDSPRGGTFDVSGSGRTFTGLITNIPIGTGYDLAFSAASPDSRWVCAGHATPGNFSVLGNKTALASVHLSCQDTQPQNGGVVGGGDVNACPTVDDFTAEPFSATVDSSIALQGFATDPDLAPSPLVYSIELSDTQLSGAGTGTLQNLDPATGAASFRCDSRGLVSIDLTVSDGDAQCAPAAFQLFVQCTDACVNVVCAPPTQCHSAGVCNHATGTCSYPPGDDGATCDDHDSDTLNDICASGVCAGFECASASDCPGVDGECRVRACFSGTCGFANAPSGTVGSTQVAGDCDRLQCNGSGDLVSVADDADLPDDSNQCTHDLCALGAPVFLSTAYGAACSQDGGQFCDGSSACIVPTFRAVRVGTGTDTLSTAATDTFVDEYTQAGTLVASVALPTAISGTNRSLMLAGTDDNASGATGGLSLSVDGSYLLLAGYDAAADGSGVADIAGTASATINRIVARIDAAGIVDTTTRLDTAFDSAAVRGATSDDGSRFWVSGTSATSQTTGGIWYAPIGGQGSVQLNTTSSVRWLNFFSGQLYASNDGAGPNIASIGSIPPPTSGAQTLTSLPANFPSSGKSPYGFAIVNVNGVTTLYMADDTSGGIEKWTLDGGTWNLSATSFTSLDTGTAAGFRGLTAIAGTSSVTLIAGTSAGPITTATPGSDRIVRFIDDGSSANPVGTVIITAGTNRAFRGLALSPH